MTDRLFIGLYPAGIVYADRLVEVAGDYKRLAFLPYATLKLDMEKNCPADLASAIRRHAAGVQARKGQQMVTSGCGQTVRLGSAI